MYRPPYLDEETSTSLMQELTKASRYNNVCIMGDFNYRGIEWDSLTGDRSSEEFLNVIQDGFFKQLVWEPTRQGNTVSPRYSRGLHSFPSSESRKSVNYWCSFKTPMYDIIYAKICFPNILKTVLLINTVICSFLIFSSFSYCCSCFIIFFSFVPHF